MVLVTSQYYSSCSMLKQPNGKKSVETRRRVQANWHNNRLLVRGILVLFLEKLLSTVMSVSWMMPLLKYHREEITEDRARARQFWIWKWQTTDKGLIRIRGSHRQGAKRRKLVFGFTGLTPRFSGRWAQGCTREGLMESLYWKQGDNSRFSFKNQITVPPQILM